MKHKKPISVVLVTIVLLSAFPVSVAEYLLVEHSKADKKYAANLQSGWVLYDAHEGVALPAPEPIDYVHMTYHNNVNLTSNLKSPDEDVMPTSSRWLNFVTDSKDNLAMKVPCYLKDILTNISVENIGERRVQIEYYGTVCTLRCPNSEFILPGVSGDALSRAWTMLCDGSYSNLLHDCLTIKENLQLCDWAYIQFLSQVSDEICGIGNEAAFLHAYLYAQSGYQMRLGVTDKYSLQLLFTAREHLCERSFFSFSDGNYYLFNNLQCSLHIIPDLYYHGRPLSLKIQCDQRFSVNQVKAQKKIGKKGESVYMCFNGNLLSFLEDYPTCYENSVEDYLKFYAQTPLGAEVEKQLYPILMDSIRNKTEFEAAGFLLNWIQTKFAYGYDSEIWGGERAFFPVETLYYPYSDCEDRSILYSRLVRDLLDLDVLLLHVPGHAATAVHFSDDSSVSGSYLELEGKKFFICDPTITGAGAPIGKAMDCMMNQSISYVRLH